MKSDVPSLLNLHIHGEIMRFSTSTVAEKLEAYRALHSTIRPKGRVERDEIMASIVRWGHHDLSQSPKRRPMTSEEILRLAQRPGHSIGAHTTHHLSLPAQSLEVQAAEIIENKRELESMLGRPVVTFAYPYGDYDSRTVEIVRSQQFVAAVTVADSLVRRNSDPMLMPRYNVQAKKIENFAGFMKRIFQSDS